MIVLVRTTQMFFFDVFFGKDLHLNVVENLPKYKHFSNDTFSDTLLAELSQVRISNNDDGFNKFLRICRNS